MLVGCWSARGAKKGASPHYPPPLPQPSSCSVHWLLGNIIHSILFWLGGLGQGGHNPCVLPTRGGGGGWGTDAEEPLYGDKAEAAAGQRALTKGV